MARVIRALRRGPSVVPAELMSARDEAARILSDAHARAAAVREQAHAAGFEAGRAEAARTLLGLEALRVRTLREAEEGAVQAALAIAQRLVGEAFAAEPGHARKLALDLLARVRRARRITLRVPSEDADAVRETLAAELERREIAASVELVADASLTRGGCVVESNLGELDARIETRLELFARALRGEVPR